MENWLEFPWQGSQVTERMAGRDIWAYHHFLMMSDHRWRMCWLEIMGSISYWLWSSTLMFLKVSGEGGDNLNMNYYWNVCRIQHMDNSGWLQQFIWIGLHDITQSRSTRWPASIRMPLAFTFPMLTFHVHQASFIARHLSIAKHCGIV